MLIPTLAQPDIQAVIEYSEAEESAVMTVRYNGGRYDVTQEGDALPLTVLQSAVSSMEYAEEKDDPLPNRLVMQIRK